MFGTAVVRRPARKAQAAQASNPPALAA